jgi:hypothetical protein
MALVRCTSENYLSGKSVSVQGHRQTSSVLSLVIDELNFNLRSAFQMIRGFASGAKTHA